MDMPIKNIYNREQSITKNKSMVETPYPRRMHGIYF